MQPDTPLPSDAAIEEALRRVKMSEPVDRIRRNAPWFPSIIELARMIEKHEPETLVDSVTRAFRAYMSGRYSSPHCKEIIAAGTWDQTPEGAAFLAGAAWQRKELGNG